MGQGGASSVGVTTVANSGLGGVIGSAGAGGSGGATVASSSQGTRASVLEHHNNAARNGVFVDAALSPTAVAALHLDSTFRDALLEGPTYAQPLYLAGNGTESDRVIVATEQNHVYAFDAQTAAVLWDATVGTPLPLSALATLRAGCGNINPLGITGTPVIDASTRTIYLDAMTSSNGAANSARHQVFAINADTGKTLEGWPVDLNEVVRTTETQFESLVQNQRGALVLLWTAKYSSRLVGISGTARTTTVGLSGFRLTIRLR